ncbi:MAG: peptidoglycan editing factor PgeF, partial [Hellea sp.]|nr:peptidoglycan editing factor PgeF [Hellea sp.]
VTASQEKTYQNFSADGIVTKTPNLAISIMSADCGPILFSDRNANIIGCCHAGWRGALLGVIANTIDAMEKLGANKKNINAVLGPCIGIDNYEVGIEFYNAFVDENKSNCIFFVIQENGEIYFNLKKYILKKLHSENLNQIDLIPDCTYELSDLYFSYRFNTHNGISDYGRNISTIMLNA